VNKRIRIERWEKAAPFWGRTIWYVETEASRDAVRAEVCLGVVVRGSEGGAAAGVGLRAVWRILSVCCDEAAGVVGAA